MLMTDEVKKAIADCLIKAGLEASEENIQTVVLNATGAAIADAALRKVLIEDAIILT